VEGRPYAPLPSLPGEADHERFIDGLIDQKRVVLGGDWLPPIAGVEAAYLLSSASLDEAREIPTSDPLVPAEPMRFEVVEWQLVGSMPARSTASRSIPI
jgi:hypothetical protein